MAVLTLMVSAACCCKAPFVIGDTISGGPGGSAFVKVAITLGQNGGTGPCKVLTLTPATVYVVPGAAIRWKVTNACASARRLIFTQPKPKVAGAYGKSATVEASVPNQERVGAPENWSFANCTSEIALVPGMENALLCEVPPNVQPGLYKYGLNGDIEPVDPDIEVRRGPK